MVKLICPDMHDSEKSSARMICCRLCNKRATDFESWLTIFVQLGESADKAHPQCVPVWIV